MNIGEWLTMWMILSIFITIYDWITDKEANIKFYTVTREDIFVDSNGLDENQPCFGCIVYEFRPSLHCDGCNDDPNRLGVKERISKRIFNVINVIF